MKMIVEQTKKYPKRMIYNPGTRVFLESETLSLMYVRKFDFPYGWIKESGTPPEPHCDSILITKNEYNLGDEVDIRLIGMFKRNDGDHKYIVVEKVREIDDYSELSVDEKMSLQNLYPRSGEGEGWFGKNEAVFCYEHCEKAF